MSLYSKLKEQYVQYRLARSDQVAINLLSCVVSDIDRVAKENKADPTDEDVVLIIRRHLKGVVELRAAVRGALAAEAVAKADHEEEILNSFLPKQLTAEEISEAVDKIREGGASNMGLIMKALREQFGTNINMQLASQIVKEKL